ncbi:asparaginase domain-containing protein [Mesorhizobium sp.]|uniref:asparaginase domain-containing protein n=1 Tax=Mesorhizobium sp. TaxID=1871066 RepID=UPI00339011CF
MEETAYFLNLVAKSEKPVIVVRAMRRPYSLVQTGRCCGQSLSTPRRRERVCW